MLIQELNCLPAVGCLNICFVLGDEVLDTAGVLLFPNCSRWCCSKVDVPNTNLFLPFQMHVTLPPIVMFEVGMYLKT